MRRCHLSAHLHVFCTNTRHGGAVLCWQLQLQAEGGGLQVQGQLLRHGPDGRGATVKHLPTTGKRVRSQRGVLSMMSAAAALCTSHPAEVLDMRSCVDTSCSWCCCVVLCHECAGSDHKRWCSRHRSQQEAQGLQHHELFWEGLSQWNEAQAHVAGWLPFEKVEGRDGMVHAGAAPV